MKMCLRVATEQNFATWGLIFELSWTEALSDKLMENLLESLSMFKSGSKKYRVNNKKFNKFERRSLKFVLCLWLHSWWRYVPTYYY